MKEALVLIFLLVNMGNDWWKNEDNQAWMKQQILVAAQQQKLALAHKKQPLYARLGVKPVTFTATAYEGSAISCGYWARFHRTYTGVKPRRGIVAVDPRVIPFHSLMYIEGYGYGQAEDIGGAIKGRHIDVFIPSLHEARKWGRKKVKVYILRKGKNSSFGQ